MPSSVYPVMVVDLSFCPFFIHVFLIICDAAIYLQVRSRFHFLSKETHMILYLSRQITVIIFAKLLHLFIRGYLSLDKGTKALITGSLLLGTLRHVTVSIKFSSLHHLS